MKNVVKLFVILSLCQSVTAQTHLAGAVSDSLRGEPILLCNVALYMKDDLVTGTDTDFDGNYFISDLEPGEYEVLVTYVGYADKRMRVNIIEGEITKLDIVLEEEAITDQVVVTQCGGPPLIEYEGLTRDTTFDVPSKAIKHALILRKRKQPSNIVGQVISKVDNSPVTCASVTLWRNGHQIAETESSIEGYFGFYNVVTGKYRLKISQDGYETESKRVKIRLNKSKELQVEMNHAIQQ